MENVLRKSKQLLEKFNAAVDNSDVFNWYKLPEDINDVPDGAILNYYERIFRQT